VLRKLFHRLRASLRRGKIEREMDAEMRFHLTMETAKNIRRGMTEEEARRTALRSFGGIEQAKEAYRHLSRVRLVEELWQDIRFSARLLLKQPGFLVVAALTLGLGIGANTAIFTVVNGVLIRSLPYRDPSQLVWIDGPGIKWEDPYSDESAWGWRNRVKSFEQVAIFGAHEGGVNLRGAGEAERIEALDVSANFFQTLGVRAVAGRLFGPEQERHENRWVAVISSRLWKRRFDSAPDAIGKTIQLNWIRSADCLRQRRQSLARSQRDAQERTGGARRIGRRARAVDPAKSDRIVAHRRIGRIGWPAAGRLASTVASRFQPTRYSASG